LILATFKASITERRLGALGRHFNDCSEHVQIVRFCVRGAERTNTFVAAGSAGGADGRQRT
jgi:hypothetical protein